MSCGSRGSSREQFENESKWPCKVCTYENFARSTKCTVCCQPRLSPLMIIGENDGGGLKSDKDIEREERRHRDRQRDIYKVSLMSFYNYYCRHVLIF